MVNLVMEVSFWGYFSCLVLMSWGKLILNNLKTYKDFSYTTYEPWSLRGELNFVFKTSHANAFLAYQDDGQHNFIEVFLYGGDVRLKTVIGDCDIQEVYVKENFNDRHWHRIRIRSEANNFTISVDDKTVMLPCWSKGYRPNKRAAGDTYLYVANFSPMTALNLNLLVFPGTFHEALSTARFQGCLGDLWITDNRGNLKLAGVISTKLTEAGCNSSCSTPHLNKCQQQGTCEDEIGRVECDCLGSGYEGPFCSKPSISVWFNATGYILYDVGSVQPGRSTLVNDITFRFATNQPVGVVMFNDVADDHVVVELVDGFLRVSWDLGQGGLELMSRKGCLHDGIWHLVTIKRTKRRIKVTVDNQKPIFAIIPGNFSFLDFKGGKEMMFFGGGPLNNAFDRSLSKANFTGFLQQLHFDEFDVVNETVHGEMFQLLGHDAVIMNASALFHLIPTNPPPLGNCFRKTIHTSEYTCEGIDDEDLCETAASGTGPDYTDCESTEDACSDPDVQVITGGPSVVHISPVNHLSSVSVTSLIHPSPTKTTPSGITQYFSLSATNHTSDLAFESQNYTKRRNQSIVKATRTIHRAIQHSVNQTMTHWVTTNTPSVPSMTKSASNIPNLQPSATALTSSNVDMYIYNVTVSKPVSSRLPGRANGTLSIEAKYSASFSVPNQSFNVSAVRGDAGRATGTPTCVFGIFVVSVFVVMN